MNNFTAVHSFTIVHSLELNPSVAFEPSIYAPKGYAYILSKDQSMQTVLELEREIERQKIRYENLLKGLNYWKNKAT